METELATLTALLLDPFLTADEAAREAAATPRRFPTAVELPTAIEREAKTRLSRAVDPLGF